jgi:hypothetical protein
VGSAQRRTRAVEDRTGCTKKPISDPAVRVSEEATVDGREMRNAVVLGVRRREVD